MCGLVGVFGSMGSKEEKLFEQLHIVDQVRGMDGAGVAIVTTTALNRPIIVKGTLSPEAITFEEEYISASRRLIRLLMGHNRAATKGKITPENAHPFEWDNITLAHNGTIRGKWRLPEHSSFETDSENICFSVAEHGIDETWKLIDGAAALTWWDAKEETFNFVRNTERPLYFTLTENGKTLIYASEIWMITGLCRRNNIKTDKIFQPKEHHLFTWKYEKNNLIKEVRKLEELKGVSRPTRYIGYGFNKQRGFLDEEFWDPNVSDKTPEQKYQREERDALTNLSAHYNTEEDDPPFVPNFLKNNKKTEEEDTVENPLHWESNHQGDIDEDTFIKQYPVCCLCPNPLVNEYQTALILTRKEAVCRDCQDKAYLHAIKLKKE